VNSVSIPYMDAERPAAGWRHSIIERIGKIANSNGNAHMSSNGRVALDDVRRVAELAHLQLNAQEESAMQRDLNAVLDYVAQLNELDTAAVPPMAQVSEILDGGVDTQESLRPDAMRPSLERSSVMVSAPHSDGVFFKVPKVIER
jgi:aspartyl-tRNA(Asn)/glutamyl-tRNA(Gln) amidotransferase subunit C